MNIQTSRFIVLAAALLLAACATPPPRPTTPPPPDSELLDRLTRRALDLDDAIRIALVNNPDARRVESNRQLAEAEHWQSRRPSNPRLSLSWLHPDAADEHTQRSIGLEFSLAEWLWLPQRRSLGDTVYQQAIAQGQAAALALSLRVQEQWFRHLAARAKRQLAERVATVAELSARLAERFHEAGNLSMLELQRQRSAAIQARIAQLATAQEARRERAALSRLLGLPPGIAWKVDAELSLPTPLVDPVADGALDARLAERADLQARRLGVQAAEQSFDWLRRWHWLGDIDIGYEVERETDGSHLRGPQLSIELPLFDQGQGRLRRSEAALQRRSADLSSAQLDAQYELADALAALREQSTLVNRFRDELLKAQAAVTEGEQRRYDFMLGGAFELLQTKAEELQLREGYIDAALGYWLANTALSAAIGERLPLDVGMPIDEARSAAPPAHQHHSAAIESPAPTQTHAAHAHGDTP